MSRGKNNGAAPTAAATWDLSLFTMHSREGRLPLDGEEWSRAVTNPEDKAAEASVCTYQCSFLDHRNKALPILSLTHLGRVLPISPGCEVLVFVKAVPKSSTFTPSGLPLPTTNHLVGAGSRALSSGRAVRTFNCSYASPTRLRPSPSHKTI